MNDNLDKILQIRNQTEKKADLYLYGEIVSEWYEAWSSADAYPNQIKNFLRGLNGQDLHIYINSPGGNVFAGMAIMQQLTRYEGRKTVHIDGVAASIASVIAMAGDEIVMPSNAMLMIHRASVCAGGNAADMEHYAEILKDIDEAILNVYTNRLRSPEHKEKIKELMDNETYLTASEVNQYFKAITVTEPLQIAAKADNAKIHYALVAEAEALKILKLKGVVNNG